MGPRKRKKTDIHDDDDDDEKYDLKFDDEVGDEKNGVKKGDFWVYVLESGSSAHYSYVGYTVDREKRLRQHNGDLKSGGAKYTHSHRPWRMMMSLKGSSTDVNDQWWTKQAALQLEWRVKHVSKGRGNKRRKRPKADPINIKPDRKRCHWNTLRIPGHPAMQRRVNDIFWLLHNRKKWSKNSTEWNPQRSIAIEMHPSIITPEIQKFIQDQCSFWNPSLTPNPHLPQPTS